MAFIEIENITERYELAIERIKEIEREDVLSEPLLSYFQKVSSFIVYLSEILEHSTNGGIEKMSLEELQIENRKIYEDIIPENYEKSYANPEYITSVIKNSASIILGADDLEDKKIKDDITLLSQMLCFVYTEIRGLIPFAYEGNRQLFTLYIELFLEVYSICLMAKQDDTPVNVAELHDTIYWFESDNCDIVIPEKLYRTLDPRYSFARDIVMNADINNERYLYLYGEYITEDEIGTMKYLSSLPEETIALMADTFTEGYRIGFVKEGKPLDKKITANIRYSLGYERVIRKAIENFKKMGLDSVIYRAATLSLDKNGQNKIGFIGGNPNRQYDFDHKDDEALYIDADFVTRKVDVLASTYEKMKKLANGHAGPACHEVFGEVPFTPESKITAVTYNDKTRKMSVDYKSRASQIINEYIIGEERSFTIIAYPVPSIGEQFEKIFEETIKLNTLDYKLYENIQSDMINVLDKADYCLVKGTGDNETNLTINLCKLNNPDKETKFENCVADVNIPVGEVFTSPVLKGTNGVLHVTKVYLNELLYKDFKLTIEDGVITDYSCANFDDEAKNKKYIKDNFLFNHETLPIGEFAIGTNTVAYKMARQFGIEGRLPILIGEKTGPHFAFGDTCYSHSEDVKVYNPDGKEIIARDNEISVKRKTDPKAAYFQCHTDVTIPYDELGSITCVCGDEIIPVFDDGRFVIKGCEELNKPLIQ